jgi:hypothetical protein
MNDRTVAYDAGDRSHVAERQKRRRFAAGREDGDLVWLMNQREGRRFLWRLLQSCHLYETSFTGTNATFFREGERNVGLQVLLDVIRLCPELHARMMAESKEENPQ